jgi:hypothetical protein
MREWLDRSKIILAFLYLLASPFILRDLIAIYSIFIYDAESPALFYVLGNLLVWISIPLLLPPFLRGIYKFLTGLFISASPKHEHTAEYAVNKRYDPSTETVFVEIENGKDLSVIDIEVEGGEQRKRLTDISTGDVFSISADDPETVQIKAITQP